MRWNATSHNKFTADTADAPQLRTVMQWSVQQISNVNAKTSPKNIGRKTYMTIPMQPLTPKFRKEVDQLSHNSLLIGE